MAKLFSGDAPRSFDSVDIYRSVKGCLNIQHRKAKLPVIPEKLFPLMKWVP